MGKEIVEDPIVEELGCGPLEEQWIVAHLGCPNLDSLNIEEDNCTEDLDHLELEEEEEFKHEISTCDARVHPNVAVSEVYHFQFYAMLKYFSHLKHL